MALAIYEIPEVKLTLISLQDYELLCRENPNSYKNTELFEGIIIDKMTKISEHIFWKHFITNSLQKILPPNFFIRNEDVIQLGPSELEPDISIVSGNFMDYRDTFPKTARLVIEISITSLQYDREKARAYATGKVDEYWIIDTKGKKVEVYTKAIGNEFIDKIIYNFSDNIPIFDSFISLKV
jgi:Uma2 family endonuclease